MFNEIYSDTWLKEQDVDIDLKSRNTDMVNPIAAIKILNAVKKIVGIVHGNNKYEVIFNGQEDTAYIDYRKQTIVLTSQLLKNPINGYSVYDIIDIEAGLALHESGHAEYTPSPITNTKMYERMNSYLKHQLFNIIEDTIMEQIVSNDFPGYEAYFLKLRNHYFKNDTIEKSDNDNMNRINEFLIGLRYTGKAKLYDQLSIKAVNLIKSYLTLPNEKLKQVDRVELMQQVYNLIIVTDNEQNNQQDDNDQKNDQNNDFDNSNQDGSSNQTSDKCDSSSDAINDIDDITGDLKEFIEQQRREQHDKLNTAESALINSMIEDEFEDDEIEVSAKKSFTVTTCKPKVLQKDIDRYNKSLKEMKKYISKFRNKFADANTIYRQNAYGLQSGYLDEDNLYSAKFNRNIFMNNVITTKSRTKNIDIAFVIDCSGSMFADLSDDGSKLRYEAARDLAVLFTEALQPINSINTWVFGFQTSSCYLDEKLFRNGAGISTNSLPLDEREKLKRSTTLIKLYSPDMKTKHAIGCLEPDGFTPEYEGLCETIKQLQNNGNKENKKVIVMLTDGEPNSTSFSGASQRTLLKKKIQECKKKDITLIHLALTSEAENTPYENKVKWNSTLGYKGLIDGFIKMLQQQIS